MTREQFWRIAPWVVSAAVIAIVAGRLLGH
jgi:hypothetical protein